MDMYHVTYANNLPGIARNGLQPGGGGSRFGGGYANHSSGRVFLTDRNGIPFWSNKLKDSARGMSDTPVREGFIPVVLRVDVPDDWEIVDDDASRRSEDGYVERAVPAGRLDIYDPETERWMDLYAEHGEEITDWVVDRLADREVYDDEGWVAYRYDRRDLLPESVGAGLVERAAQLVDG